MHRSRLKQLLGTSQCLKAPGIYDGLSALLVEQSEFDLCFFSGGGFSFARYGKPDLGLISMQEVADAVAIIRDRISLPMIVDIDTGFGNALNVQRTVQVMERAGASALQMEDQVMPKRCGHLAGKEVIPCEDMVDKIKAALDTREDPDLAIIARTDALAVNGFEDATERAERYLEAGADLLFIEAPQTSAHMHAISERFGGRIPLVHNLVEGGHSPVSSSDALAQLGYRIALYPIALLNQFVPQAQQLLSHIHAHGDTTTFPGDLIDIQRFNALLGTEELLAGADYRSTD